MSEPRTLEERVERLELLADRFRDHLFGRGARLETVLSGVDLIAQPTPNEQLGSRSRNDDQSTINPANQTGNGA